MFPSWWAASYSGEPGKCASAGHSSLSTRNPYRSVGQDAVPLSETTRDEAREQPLPATGTCAEQPEASALNGMGRAPWVAGAKRWSSSYAIPLTVEGLLIRLNPFDGHVCGFPYSRRRIDFGDLQGLHGQRFATNSSSLPRRRWPERILKIGSLTRKQRSARRALWCLMQPRPRN